MATPNNLDSFVKYFLDVKPYHTKLLEVIERYLFTDNLDITLTEDIQWDIDIGNQPYCTGVGFGLDYDDECGFDATSCCDLFDCLGGYGLIFDNSDLLVSTPLLNAYPELDGIEVSGDHRYDTFIQIEDILDSETIRVSGDYTDLFDTHSLFLIIPKEKIDILESYENGFYVQGNKVSTFESRQEFQVYSCGNNDGIYSCVDATYDSTNNKTFVQVSTGNINESTLNSGYILIKSGTKNNGVYQSVSASFSGGFTDVTINPDSSFFKLLSETKHGTIVLRTALSSGRRIWINDDDVTDESFVGEWKIVDVFYSASANITALVLDGDLGSYSEGATVELRGYFFGAGFDGLEECTIPKPFNVHAGFSEYLNIEVIEYLPTVSPTPTQSVTPSITISV